MGTDSIIQRESYGLALDIIRIVKKLRALKEYELASQLMRSGTSVGANVREARQSETKPDFAHKMSIAQKECSETVYWLELIADAGIISHSELNILTKQAKKLLRMIRSTVYTTRQNIEAEKNAKKSNTD